MKWRFDSQVLCESDPIFVRRLDECVRSFWTGDHENWESFLRKLPGYYPLDVWQSLSRLNLESGVLGIAGASVARQIFPEPFPNSLEHPLDYEWRFTQESIRDILDFLTQEIADFKQPSVACLGCPSVVVAGDEIRPSWSWSLLDRRADLLKSQINSAHLMACDLTKPISTHPLVDIAVVDPPWYNHLTKHFMVKAQSIVKPGGLVLLSFPLEGTRSSASKELAELLNWCKEGGLELNPSNKIQLHYKTPFFESTSLKAAGFSARIPAWRSAEVLIFRNRVSDDCRLTYNDDTPRLFTTEWNEFIIQGIKFSVKNSKRKKDGKQGCSGGAFLSPVWREAILPSVSTNFVGRARANLVTSGNRFFECSDPYLLAEMLLAGQNRDGEINISTNAGGERNARELNSVLQSEINDRTTYLKEMYD